MNYIAIGILTNNKNVEIDCVVIIIMKMNVMAIEEIIVTIKIALVITY